MKNKKNKPTQSIATYIIYTRTLSSKVGIPPTYSTHTDTDTQDEGGLNIFCISRKITRKRKVVCWGFCPPSTSVTLLHLFLCQLNVSLFFLFLFFFFFHTFLEKFVYLCSRTISSTFLVHFQAASSPASGEEQARREQRAAKEYIP